MLLGAERQGRLGRIGRAAGQLCDHGDRHRGERWLRAWCHTLLARCWHAGAPGQPVQAAAVRQGQRGSGEERSARCPDDRLVRRHHADTSGAAPRAGCRTAGRDARRSPPAQRRESRRREWLQTAGRCDAEASFSPPHRQARRRYRSARRAPGRDRHGRRRVSSSATDCLRPCRVSDPCWPAR